jgi:hypothetical protein
MSLPAKYPPQVTPASWNAMVDAANGMTVAGGVTIQYPYTFIVRVNGGFYEAVNSYGVITYGGSGDIGGIDGTYASSVIQAALNALTAGRTWVEKVVFKGSITLTAQITVPNYTEIDLTDAILTANNLPCALTYGGVFYIANTSQNIIIHGGKINAAAANQTDKTKNICGIYVGNTSDVIHIYDVYIQNALWCGICFDVGVTNSVIRNVRIDNSGSEYTGAFPPHAIYCDGANNLIIDKVYCYNNILASGGGVIKLADHIYDARITNCLIKTYSGIGIEIISFTAGYNIRDVLIDNCTVRNAIAVTSIGLSINVTVASTIKNVTVSNNHFFANGGFGIQVAASGTGTTFGIKLQGNTINNLQVVGASAGIILEGATNVTIDKNVIYDDQDPTCMVYGVREFSGADYNVIVNNDFGTVGTSPVILTGTHTIVKHNRGYVTENSGSLQILTGETTVNGPHGLAAEPTSIVLGASSPDVSDAFYGMNATTIFIAVLAAPEANRYVSWYAEFKPAPP